ncbi:MAG: CoA transferase [Rhodospirillaceae bacterium]|nr:CoA transferase [Rhodospirillaceae bacterium]MBT5665662.1 CoA transferase [Rhodospirillaceae bacterium]
MAGPLDGVRVIDLSTVMYGPYCTMILGEMGAEVIKVEPPSGDITRQVGESRTPGMAAGFLGKGRNKRSLALDLKQDLAREALYKFVATADVFIHNIRPGAAARLGIDYDSIIAHRPDIVYCAAVGFLPEGPYAENPAYDDLIQGMSGLAWLQGQVTGEPRYAPSVIADKTSGLFALYAIMMGLFHRERTGEGQKVDVGMFESFASFILPEHMQGRTYDPPTGPAGYKRLLTKNRRPYPTKDGYVCAMPYTDRHWRALFELADKAELADDPRFATMPARTSNIDVLYGVLGEILLTRTTAEWLEAFKANDLPAAKMNSVEDLFDDPHLDAVNFFGTEEHPTEGRLKHIRPPIRMSKSKPGPGRPAEHVGQSTRDLLQQAGLSSAEIDALIANGAAGEPSDS